jgi:hypothetical protein
MGKGEIARREVVLSLSGIQKGVRKGKEEIPK